MMTARKIVIHLLESEHISDLYQYAMQSNLPPGQLVADTLRDQLVERGWRHIRVEPDTEDGQGYWLLTAGYVDAVFRSEWAARGARVAPRPDEPAMLRAMLVRQFKAAAKRAGMSILEVTNLELIGNGEVDLQQDYGDFENDPGDWRLAIRFKWQPSVKFWSIASQSLGYETKPYQKAQHLQHSQRSLPATVTDEPTEVSGAIKRILARHGGKAPEPETLEQQQAWARETIKPQ